MLTLHNMIDDYDDDDDESLSDADSSQCGLKSTTSWDSPGKSLR